LTTEYPEMQEILQGEYAMTIIPSVFLES
jgi:hypothetical protein